MTPTQSKNTGWPKIKSTWIHTAHSPHNRRKRKRPRTTPRRNKRIPLTCGKHHLLARSWILQAKRSNMGKSKEEGNKNRGFRIHAEDNMLYAPGTDFRALLFSSMAMQRGNKYHKTSTERRKVNGNA